MKRLTSRQPSYGPTYAGVLVPGAGSSYQAPAGSPLPVRPGLRALVLLPPGDGGCGQLSPVDNAQLDEHP